MGVVPALVNFPSPELILQSRSAHFRVKSKRDVITKNVFIPLGYRRCSYDIAPKASCVQSNNGSLPTSTRNTNLCQEAFSRN